MTAGTDTKSAPLFREAGASWYKAGSDGWTMPLPNAMSPLAA